MESRIINPWTWQDSRGFVQGREVSGATRTLYCAGVTSVDADGVVMHAGDMAAQLMQALDNLEAILDAAGYTLADVVRLTTYTTDVDACVAARPPMIRRLLDADCRYASTLLGITRLAQPGLLVELEATAAR
jgi:enamine deaminase RidA (YjgF/YER057c/UK114 family)